MRLSCSLLAVSLLASVDASSARAQTAQLVPAFPLFCQGPLTTGAPSGRETTTPFKWAATGAGAASPKPGECVWADRAARGSEIKTGGGNEICDFSGAMKSVPANKFIEIGVFRDSQVGDCMHLFRYLGDVNPPFSPIPALEPFTRQSIAKLNAAQIASLRKGVQVMMSRPVTDPTSYAFQANIHGTTANPTDPAETEVWNNCEHASFYFASWHRMYLYYFDRILRAAAGDPNLVLPYWNWQDPAQFALPAPFRSPANSGNSLFVASPGRPSSLNGGTALLNASVTESTAANADTGFETGGATGHGFGGGASAPTQFDGATGDLENQPHNIVHSTLAGLMGDPLTAAEDPIFWLHHAQIDRLWSRWLHEGGGRTDPGDAAWLNTKFTFFDEAQHAVTLTGAEVVDSVGQLNYRYDDDPAFVKARREELATTARAEAVAPSAAPETLAISGETQTRLDAKPVRFQIPLAQPARDKMKALAARPQGRVFLQIDDIHTEKPPGFYYAVYLNPPNPDKIDAQSPGFVGNLSLFAMRSHSAHGDQPATHGFMAEYDVTRFFAGGANPESASVVLVPRGLVNPEGQDLPLEGENVGVVGSVRFVTR